LLLDINIQSRRRGPKDAWPWREDSANRAIASDPCVIKEARIHLDSTGSLGSSHGLLDGGDFLRTQARFTVPIFTGQHRRIEITTKRIGDDAVGHTVFAVALFQQCVRDQLAVAICNGLRDDWLTL